MIYDMVGYDMIYDVICYVWYVICYMWYVICDMRYVMLCDMLYLICDIWYVMWYVICGTCYVIRYTLYVIRDTWYVICYMLYVICDMLYAIRYSWYVICYMWYVICDMWCDTIRFDTVRYDTTRHGMIWWYDMTCYDMVWYMIWYDMKWYDIWYDTIWYGIFVICNCVDTRWQQYSTHLHTNNTQNNTKFLEECGPCPIFCGFYPGICLTSDEIARRKPQSYNCFLKLCYVLFRKLRRMHPCYFVEKLSCYLMSIPHWQNNSKLTICTSLNDIELSPLKQNVQGCW